MGVLRLFLAITVLLWHCPEGVITRVLHPALAVQCFYAVSGFLIQLVIPRYQNQGGNWPLAFYKSRAARLMPLYWLFTALTMLFLGHEMLNGLTHDGDYLGLSIYTFNNLFLMGQDILRFFSYNLRDHHFSLLPPFTEKIDAILTPDVTFGSNLTIMRQSWTLAVELWFYLLAPFLLFRASGVLITVICLGILSRCGFAYYGYIHQTFLYGNILSEISVFLCGALAARFYNYALIGGELKRLLTHHLPEKTVEPFLNLLGYAALALLMTYYIKWWPDHPRGGTWGKGLLQVPYRYWFAIIITIFALPWIFHTFGKWKWDRFIGDLSYPVYISHAFFVSYTNKMAIPERYITMYVLALSLAVSVLLIILVERPLDNWRHKRFRQPAKESP